MDNLYNIPTIEYASLTNKHKIIFKVDYKRHEALIDTMDIKNDSPVELAILLINICKDMKEKKIERIIQQIYEDDWKNILERDGIFKLINKNNQYNFVNVYVEIEKFPQGVMKALGFDDI